MCDQFGLQAPNNNNNNSFNKVTIIEYAVLYNYIINIPSECNVNHRS